MEGTEGRNTAKFYFAVKAVYTTHFFGCCYLVLYLSIRKISTFH